MSILDQDQDAESSESDIDSNLCVMIEIAKLLTEIGHEKHIGAFVKNEIDYPMFLNLEDNDLKDIGIEAFGSRKKILGAIQALKL